MKYLKIFEKFEDIDTGDYIILLNADKNDILTGYKNGEIYKITSINAYGEYPYKIQNIGEENPFSYTKLKKYQFRLATPEEITAKKYNIF